MLVLLSRSDDMRLSVSRDGNLAGEFRLKDPPIYIGRQMGSQVFLPDRGVSRQHAVIYLENDTWIIQDLDSANKTFRNKEAIHKAEFGEGDIIEIGIFTLQVHFDPEPSKEDTAEEMQIHLDDTFTEEIPEVHTIVRNPEAHNAELIRLPAKRIRDFSRASQIICNTVNIGELHSQLLRILLRQFSALDAWAALRETPEGPMDCEGGRRIDSITVKIEDLAAQKALAEAMGKSKYVLVPKLPREISQGHVRSAIVAPVMKNNKSYGVLYAENSKEHGHYSLSDLDYLMFIAVHAAATLDSF